MFYSSIEKNLVTLDEYVSRMKENQDKTGAYFMIPSNSKILYVYRLDVRDIKNNTQN